MPSGSTSSRYETLEVIGSGGMATVWKARDRVLGRLVALKRPHPSPDDSVVAARFRREARAAAAVSHPNLVTVYDVGVDDDGPFLVMELLDAPSLAETTVPLPAVHRVGSEMASALVALHAAGIVHRDIKPANIMLTNGGAQLTDFGIARSLSDAETLTQAGTTFATPAYAAPEVVSGGEYTEASDVYALATVLRELVVGRPVIANDATQVMVTNPAWRSLLDPCLSPDPKLRPSAASFLVTLQGIDAPATVPIATVPMATVPIATPSIPSNTETIQATSELYRQGPLLPLNRPGAAVLADDQADRSPIAMFVFGLVILAVAALAFGATRDGGPSGDEALVPPSLDVVTSPSGVDTAPATPVPVTAAPVADPEPAPEPTAALTEPPIPEGSLTESPPADGPIDDVAAARNDFESFIGEIRGTAISDKEADKLIDDLANLVEAAQENDARNLDKRVESVSDRIDDKVEGDTVRERAEELFDVLRRQLGIDLDD